MGSEWDPENVFDVLGDELAREIIALADVEPMSAQELADHCGSSLPTVYRRTNVLLDHDMLEEDTKVDPEGNNYKTFATKLDRVCLEVEDGGFTIDVRLRRDLVDRFSDFWDDFDGGAGDDG